MAGPRRITHPGTTAQPLASFAQGQVKRVSNRNQRCPFATITNISNDSGIELLGQRDAFTPLHLESVPALELFLAELGD
jgi:hypothetical protein